MILQNFYQVLMSKTGYLFIKVMNGNLIRTNDSTSYPNGFLGIMVSTIRGINKGGISGDDIVVGTGTTEVDFLDYKLDNMLTSSSIKYLSSNSSFTYGENGLTINLYKTIENITEEPITITEIGAACSQYNSYYNYPYLMTRELLETPVTVQPGDSAQFHIKIDMF